MSQPAIFNRLRFQFLTAHLLAVYQVVAVAVSAFSRDEVSLVTVTRVGKRTDKASVQSDNTSTLYTPLHALYTHTSLNYRKQ